MLYRSIPPPLWGTSLCTREAFYGGRTKSNREKTKKLLKRLWGKRRQFFFMGLWGCYLLSGSVDWSVYGAARVLQAVLNLP